MPARRKTPYGKDPISSVLRVCSSKACSNCRSDSVGDSNSKIKPKPNTNMNKTHIRKLLPATLLLASLVAVQANPLQFKLSPPGSSPAPGLSPANEVPAVTNSSGSGGEILTGLSFDTNTLQLSLAVGYG